MNYELAKKIKDAGFPQNGLFYFKKVRYKRGWKNVLTACQGELYSDIENGCISPTLSELIEACWKYCHEFRLDCYKHSPKEWHACTSWGDGEDDWQIGSTPEEATAYLWVMLNKNK